MKETTRKEREKKKKAFFLQIAAQIARGRCARLKKKTATKETQSKEKETKYTKGNRGEGGGGK